MGYEKFGPEDRQVTVMGGGDTPDLPDVKSLGGGLDKKVDVTDANGQGIDPIVFAGLQNQRARVQRALGLRR